MYNSRMPVPSSRNKKFLAAALVAAAFLAAPARADRTDLKIGFTQYPATLNPYFDGMVAKSYVLGTALRPVTVYGPDWQPACMLCTELPSYANGRAKKVKLENGKTGIAATYTLKENLFWDDGAPVTTRDILFAWNVARHPQTGADNTEFFATDIAKVSAADDRTFTVTFAAEKCDFSAIGDFYPLPEHLEKKVFEQDPATYASRTLYNTAPATPGLYLGPYRVVKAESGAALTVGKNPHWKGPVPAFDTITFRAIENSAALSANLLSGGIDYIAGELGLSLDQGVAFEKRLAAAKPGAYAVTYKPGLTFEHIDLPLGNPVFADVRLRRALMHGMDRATINDALFGGRQMPALTDINPLDAAFTADVAQYPFDPARAAVLLDEAGWKMGEDGIRRNAKGEKLSFPLATTAGNRTRETVAQALQSNWRALGIDVTLENVPARVLFGDIMRKRAFKGGVMYAWMSAPENIPKTTLHSSMIPTPANNFAGQNYPGYDSRKMDGIIDALDTVCGEKENLALWHDLQKLYAQDLPALPLYYRADTFIVPSWLTGIVPTGHLNPTTLWVESWGVSG